MLHMPKVKMLRLQASPKCNLNCSYCYIPESSRRGGGNMADEVLEASFRRLIDEDLLGPALTISWHGAEPLVPGVAWYRRALKMIDDVIGDRVTVSHTFQTNGVLITEAWCDLFEETGAIVGVSLDGNADQNASRVNWSGRPAYALALRGVERLNNRGIPWTLLSVITLDTMKDPEGFSEFVASSGCSGLGFKVEETNVDHESDLDNTPDVEDLYSRFVLHLWEKFPPGGALKVREFNEYLMARGQDASCQTLPVTLIPLRNITVAANGDFTILSGELLFKADGGFVFGNVLNNSFMSSLRTDMFRDVGASILSGVKRCAKSCEFYAQCGSFYISQKHAESGTFDIDETAACRLEVKTLFRALDSIAPH